MLINPPPGCVSLQMHLYSSSQKYFGESVTHAADNKVIVEILARLVTMLTVFLVKSASSLNLDENSEMRNFQMRNIRSNLFIKLLFFTFCII